MDASVQSVGVVCGANKHSSTKQQPTDVPGGIAHLFMRSMLAACQRAPPLTIAVADAAVLVERCSVIL